MLCFSLNFGDDTATAFQVRRLKIMPNLSEQMGNRLGFCSARHERRDPNSTNAPLMMSELSARMYRDLWSSSGLIVEALSESRQVCSAESSRQSARHAWASTHSAFSFLGLFTTVLTGYAVISSAGYERSIDSSFSFP